MCNFSLFCCRLTFKIIFPQRIFQEHYQSSNSLDPDQDRRSGSKLFEKSLLIVILLSSDFQNHLFPNNLSGTLSEFQTVWIQVRTDVLGANCLKRIFGKNKLFLRKVRRRQYKHEKLPSMQSVKVLI